jgi:hypothetical protein
MDTEQKMELLSVLVRIQENSAPITIEIGNAKTGHVESDCIVIKNAPPIVIFTLAKRGYNMDVTSEGVEISYISTP